MSFNKNLCLLGAILFLAILARLVCHLPNFVPTLAIIIVLMRQQSLLTALLSILFIQIFSDVLLSSSTEFGAFGLWSIFTYSGYVALTVAIVKLGKQWSSTQQLLVTAPCSVAYWLWTNLGTWLMSNMYQHTLSGFMLCYVKALPFLRNAVIADVLWVAALVGLYHLVRKLNGNQLRILSA